MMRRRGALLLLGLLGLAGCGGPLDEPPSRWRWRPGDTGALLRVHGNQTFEGRIPARCVVHAVTGLQVNLRTGDPGLPAVAVRIGSFQGKGSYQGEVFVTGRNATGALVRSTGEVRLDVRQVAAVAGTTGATGMVLLGGWFDGSYAGPAGKGVAQGRFGGCAFTPRPLAGEEPEMRIPDAPAPPPGSER